MRFNESLELHLLFNGEVIVSGLEYAAEDLAQNPDVDVCEWFNRLTEDCETQYYKDFPLTSRIIGGMLSLYTDEKIRRILGAFLSDGYRREDGGPPSFELCITSADGGDAVAQLLGKDAPSPASEVEGAKE